MPPIKLIYSFLLLLILATSCAHSNFTASGIVKGKNKKGIAGVNVSCDCAYGCDTVQTDSTGRFNVSVFEAGLKLRGKSKVYVFKEGYKPRYVVVRNNKTNIIKLNVKSEKWKRSTIVDF